MSAPSAPTLTRCRPCAPATERGRGVLLGASARDGGVLVYASGRAVVVRALDDDAKNNDVAPRLYHDHQYSTTCARPSPNGEWIASGDVSGRVRVWGLNDDFTLKAEHRPIAGAVDDIAWSADGQRIVASGDGKGGVFAKAFAWDGGSGIGDVSGQTKRVNSCDFRPARPFKVVTASEDFAVSMFAGPPFRFARSVHKHANYANCVRYSPSGELFASVSSDGTGKIFHGDSGDALASIPKGGKTGGGHAGTVYGLAWSPCGTKALTCGADKTCRLWEIPAAALETARGKKSTTTPSDPNADPSSESETSTAAAAAKAPPSCVELATFAFEGGAEAMQVGCVFVGERMASLSLSGVVNVLSLDDPCGAPSSRALLGHPKSVSCLAVDVDGGGDVFSASLSSLAGGDAVVIRWSESDDGGDWSAVVSGEKHGHKSVVAITAKGAGGGRVLTVGMDDTLRVIMVSENTEGGVGDFAYVPGAALKLTEQPRDVDADASGALAVVATTRGFELVHVDKTRRNVSPAAVLQSAGYTALSPEGGAERVLTAGMSPDGGEVAVGCKDGAVHVFAISKSTNDGGGGSLNTTETRVLSRHRGEVTSARYSPCGGKLATCDGNREVVVWDARSGEVIYDKAVFHKARVTAVAWSPDSRRLATGSLDGGVIVWDLAKPAMSGHVKIENAHAGGCACLEWKDENALVTGGFDACVKTWRVP